MTAPFHKQSTTVRTPAEARVAARKAAIERTRVTVGWVQRVSPGLAAMGVERIFLSPRRHERPEHERAAFASAVRSKLMHRGHRVPVYSWGDPQRPVVLFAHGWEGRASQVAPYLTPLLAAGFRVVSFDAPGHGEAGSALVSVLDISAVAEHVAGSLVQPIQAVIGHSAGAAALLLASARKPFTERIVAIAPPSRPGAFLKFFARMLSLSPATEQALNQRLFVRYARPFADVDSVQSVVGLKAHGLIVHDRADTDVPFAHGEAIAQAWTNSRLLATEGLGHRRVLRDPTVVQTVVDFIGAPAS
jgi:pimeloyl-ACP methyl ester carboxylesterase